MPNNTNSLWDAENFFWNQWEFFTMLAQCEFNSTVFIANVEKIQPLSDNDKQLLRQVIHHVNINPALKKLCKDGVYVTNEDKQAEMINAYVAKHAYELKFWEYHGAALSQLFNTEEAAPKEKYPTQHVFITVLDENNSDEFAKMKAVEQLRQLCVKEVNRYEEKFARELQIMLADFKSQHKGKAVKPNSLQALHSMITAILNGESEDKKHKVSDEFKVYFMKLRGSHPAFEALYFKREIFRELMLHVMNKDNLTPNDQLINMNNYLASVQRRSLTQHSNALRKALERVLTKISTALNPQWGQKTKRLFGAHAVKAIDKIKKTIDNAKPGFKG